MTTPVVHVHRALSSCFHPGIIATGSPFGDGDCSSGHEKKPGDPDAQPSTYLGHSGGEPPAWPLRDDDDDDVDDALEKPPQQQPEPPTAHRMDGGLEAWLQVLGSWLLFINTWGLTNSYGTFQTYYSSDASPIPSYASSSLSWIGSMQSFLTMFMGSLAGPLVDAGYMRAALVAGTCLEVVGLLATSFSTQLWQLFLFQGLTVGLGSGMLSTASLTIIPMYFKEMKMTASGIAASGSAVGKSELDQEKKKTDNKRDQYLTSVNFQNSWYRPAHHAAQSVPRHWVCLERAGLCPHSLHAALHGMSAHKTEGNGSEGVRSDFPSGHIQGQGLYMLGVG